MRPYRFERTLVVLAGLALALIVGTAAAVFASHNHLLLDSPRGWHFLYLSALIVAGIAAAPRPRLAAVLLSLATIEIGLGMGSALLYKYHWHRRKRQQTGASHMVDAGSRAEKQRGSSSIRNACAGSSAPPESLPARS